MLAEGTLELDLMRIDVNLVGDRRWGRVDLGLPPLLDCRAASDMIVFNTFVRTLTTAGCL
jgi:hypothetical protein